MFPCESERFLSWVSVRLTRLSLSHSRSVCCSFWFWWFGRTRRWSRRWLGRWIRRWLWKQFARSTDSGHGRCVGRWCVRPVLQHSRFVCLVCCNCFLLNCPPPTTLTERCLLVWSELCPETALTSPLDLGLGLGNWGTFGAPTTAWG